MNINNKQIKQKSYRKIEFQLSKKVNILNEFDNIQSKSINDNIKVINDSKSINEIGLFDPLLVNDVMNWNKISNIGSGLFNQGNTCFLNATLQCLFYIPPLTQILLSDDSSKKALRNVPINQTSITENYNNNNKLVVSHYRKLLSEVWRSKATISPRGIIQNLKKIGKQFRQLRQEDAHEFLIQLLDCMHEEILKCNGLKSSDGKISETSFISRIFGCYICNEVSCPLCKYSSKTFNYSQCLSLDVNHIQTINKAIDFFLKSEQLSHGNEWKCEKCNQKVNAKKQMSLSQFPKILVLHLKRFAYSSSNYFSGGKINKHIQFDLKLTINSNNQIKIYDLCGVIVHIGSSAHSGHYIAYVKGTNGIWHLMDDSTVRPVAVQQVLKQQAYILFYSEFQPTVVSNQSLNSINNSSNKQTVHSNINNNTNSNNISNSIDSDNFTTEELSHLNIQIIPNKEIVKPLVEISKSDIIVTNRTIISDDRVEDAENSHSDNILDPNEIVHTSHRIVGICSYKIRQFSWPENSYKYKLISRRNRMPLRKKIVEDPPINDVVVDNQIIVYKEYDDIKDGPIVKSKKNNKRKFNDESSDIDDSKNHSNQTSASVNILNEINTIQSNKTSDYNDIVILLIHQSNRGNNIGSEGGWDDTNPKDSPISNHINDNQSKFKSSNQVDDHNARLDAGRTKKIKIKQNIDRETSSNINKFQLYVDSHNNLK